MRKNINALNESVGISEITCPHNVDSGKFDTLKKTCNKYGHIIADFDVEKGYFLFLPTNRFNRSVPYIERTLSGRWGIGFKSGDSLDVKDVDQFIKDLKDTKELCKFLNKEDFKSYKN